jgi:colanic acid biosynthesis glycosyl transferase WcaI
MRILLFTQFCTPEPIFKSVPFARELARRGHEVRILTGFPNYPGGKIYSGYKISAFYREIIDGIPVLRTPLYPSHSGSTLGRISNYFSFSASAFFPLVLGWKPDLIYIYNLVTLGAVALVNKAFRNVPFVLDLQDLWPDSILHSGIGSRWMRTPVSHLCSLVYKGASALVAQSPGFRATLIKRGVPSEKIHVIYNWCDESHLGLPCEDNLTREALGFEGWFNILYAGNIGLVQGLESVIESAKLLALTGEKIRFVFMGAGVALKDLQAHAVRTAPHNVLFLPPCSVQRAFAIQRMSDALLIHLQKSPLFEVTIPSKTQSYLASGKPVLAAVQGDAGRLIEQARAGLVAEPQNAESIAQAAIKLARMSKHELDLMGESGRTFYQREISLQTGVGRFETVFEEVLRSSPVQPAGRAYNVSAGSGASS